MRYFLDTEFDENGSVITPLSLGLVAEDGRELYVEFDYDERKVASNTWVCQHVLPYLSWPKADRLSRYQVAERLRYFVGTDPQPRFWAHYGDYDWVLLCRCFGRMIDLPPNFPKLCLDTQQLWIQLGSDPSLRPPTPPNEHHALPDARWTRAFHSRMLPVAQARGLYV